MRRKEALWGVAALVGVLIVGWEAGVFPEAEAPQRGVTLSGKEYRLEVADTPAEREKGLSDRDSLCESCGMLFVFPEPGPYPFWMHDTRFPLDILWLREGNIVWIERSAAPDSDRLLVPPGDADHVLELPGGAASDLAVGQTLRIEGR